MAIVQTAEIFPEYKGKIWVKPFRATVRGIFKTVFRTKIRGMEKIESLKGQPMVIVADHTSMFDGALLAATLPVDAMYAIDTYQYEKFKRHPIFGPLMDSVEMYTLDPANTKSIDRMTEKVKAGKPLVIFPEGTLTSTGSFMPIESLAAQLSARAGAWVIPVYLGGMNFMPFGSFRLENHPWRFFPRLSVTALEPQKIKVPDGVDVKKAISTSVRKNMRRQLERIMHAMPVDAMDKKQSLMEALYEAAGNYGWGRNILDGLSHENYTYNDVVAGSIVFGKKLAAVTEKDENVGLLLPATEAATFALFGLHNEGRIIAPLNLLHEPARLLSCADTVQMKTVVTSRKLVQELKMEKQIDALAASGRKIVYLEDVKSSITPLDRGVAFLQARVPFLRPGRYKNGDELAVIVFTSGTTSEPKGVCLSSANLLSNILASSAVLPLTPADRFLNVMPLFHSFGLEITLMSLMRGIPLFQFPKGKESKNVTQAFFDTRATILMASDSMIYKYAKAAKDGHFSLNSKIFIGAEKMRQETVDLLRKRFSVTPFEGYGTTEASPVLAFNLPSANKPGTVGRALPGIEVRLEDANEKGKFFTFRGPNRMLGYMFHDHPGDIRAPDGSEEYLPDAFYNTGDIVNVDEEGFISLIDRIGNFIKVNGEMIPGAVIEDIARAASAKPNFEHAVFHTKDVEGNNRFVLYTTDTSIDRSKMVAAAAATGKKPGGIPDNEDIIHIERLPRLAGTDKKDMQGLKRMYNEMVANKPPRKSVEDTAPEVDTRELSL